MESPRVKRRKLLQEQFAAQKSLVNNGEMNKSGLMGPLQESTELISHRLDVCFGMVSLVFHMCNHILFILIDLDRSKLRRKA